MSWRPIETAPQDGEVLIFLEDGKICVASQYQPGVWVCDPPTIYGPDDPRLYASPTHWMPLPAAPPETPREHRPETP